MENLTQFFSRQIDQFFKKELNGWKVFPYAHVMK